VVFDETAQAGRFANIGIEFDSLGAWDETVHRAER